MKSIVNKLFNRFSMNIGFEPCGLTTREAINKLVALGGINKSDLSLTNTITGLYWYIDTSNGYIYCHESHLDVKLNPKDIPEKINKISELPSEILQLLLQRQLDAGSKGDIRVFDRRPTADNTQGGFVWNNTPEGSIFWDDFFSGKFYLYYTLNHKQNETKLQDKTTFIRRGENLSGSGICCKRCKPTIAGGSFRDRKAIKL